MKQILEALKIGFDNIFRKNSQIERQLIILKKEIDINSKLQSAKIKEMAEKLHEVNERIKYLQRIATQKDNDNIPR